MMIEATGDPTHLERARAVVSKARELFEDPAGGFFFAARAPDLVVRMKEAADGAQPSGNSVMALLFARLGALTHDEELREMGKKCVRAFSEELKAVGFGPLEAVKPSKRRQGAEAARAARERVSALRAEARRLTAEARNAEQQAAAAARASDLLRDEARQKRKDAERIATELAEAEEALRARR